MAQPVAKPKKATLEWLRSISGELASATLKKLDDTLPWYRDMPPARRSAVGLVAQAGIQSFVSWFDDPDSQPWVAADVFGGAPRELLRSVSLQETLQLIRVVVNVVEERVVAEDPTLREAVLLYSREIAFSAADVYARAAEARGLWDARLEALVVDSIISGEQEEELASRIAALGWRAQGSVAVLVGPVSANFDEDALRRISRKLKFDVLVGVQGNRVLVVMGRVPEGDDEEALLRPFMDLAVELEPNFGSGTLVIGPEVSSISLGHISAKAALSAFAVTKTITKKQRLISADELLAERALAGDSLAKATLVERLYRPLAKNAPELFQTLLTYLDNGRSLESTAREMFVHPNTVRYRLKRIAEILDCDPTGAREAFVLQVAVTLGTMTANPRSKGKLG